MTIPAPNIEYSQLSPILIALGTALAGLVVEAFLPRRCRYIAQLVMAISGLGAALVAVIVLVGHYGNAVMGRVVVDAPTLFFQGSILVIGIASVALIAGRRLGAFAPLASTVPGSTIEAKATKAGIMQTEIFPLTILAVAGMLLLPASGDLLTMFVALEVLSLPLYLLCGLARRRRLLSQEAALKYFLLGAFSSAFFLYGIALLYGYAGTLTLSGVRNAIGAHGGDQSLALVGIALLSVGLLFKVGAVPFHSWIPDVYQGAPTPITAFMAAATKIAAFGALLRIFYVALPGLQSDWRPVLSVIAILTMLTAAVLTVTQTDVKRLLAYSSVNNAGFILIGVIVGSRAGLSSAMFYLLAYAFTTFGAFAVVALIRNADGDEDTEISHWVGLGKRFPVVAGILALFLLGMAGIPLTGGFVSKLTVLTAALADGAAVVFIVGVISSLIAAFAYARLIVVMFFSDPTIDTPSAAPPGAWAVPALGVGVTATVVLGLAPDPVLRLADQAAQFLP